MRAQALFIGHGNPMNAIVPNRYADAWRELGRSMPRPTGVLAISAHWYRPGIAVTVAREPRTIHDFGGFPRALFEVQYPAAGSPALAQRITELLHPLPVRRSEDWGLDHGTWSVLMHVFPDADVPVVQVCIDSTLPFDAHFALGRRLAPLREEGVLVLGSGDIVHNLALARREPDAPPYPWALAFSAHVRAAIEAGDDAALTDPGLFGEAAALSIPTAEHYLPLLYVLGARLPGDRAQFPVDGIEMGSIDMLSVGLAPML